MLPRPFESFGSTISVITQRDRATVLVSGIDDGRIVEKSGPAALFFRQRRFSSTDSGAGPVVRDQISRNGPFDRVKCPVRRATPLFREQDSLTHLSGNPATSCAPWLPREPAGIIR